MIIGVDIGNTTTEIGFIENLNNIKSYKISTDKNKTKDEWSILLSLILKNEKIFKTDVEAILVSSVVPTIDNKISQAFKETLSLTPLFIGKDLQVPIENRYKKPEEVGADRLLNVFSATRKIKPPLIVVDLGTAVTFDVVDEDGAYEGGLIFPGINSSVDCLFSKAEKLPKIDIKFPNYVTGKTTEESINAGIFWGYISLIEGIVNLIEKEYKKSFKVVITGGNSELIFKGLKEGYILNRKLAMEGFYYLYKNLSK